ncbi:hypothetical protein BUE80_DR004714 [Diplocarpon rosae]|nr:hypothetical protein BUE80_DR004714 [Diplocarpon rosae]
MAVEGAESWDVWRLIEAGAQNTASVKAPCLVEAGDLSDPAASTELGVFFRREYWDVSDGDYRTLKQSMLLASNLLRAGLPFLMNYAPTYRAYDLLRVKEPAIQTSTGAYQIDQAAYGSLSEDETLTELGDIARVIKWQLNHTIAEHQRWVGVTRLVTDDEYGPRPWVDLLVKDVEASDQELKNQGFARRFLIIGIMKEYVDALKRFPQDSQEYLRATFLAAVTMTHEIAHAVWHQDYRSMENEYAGFEPYYDNHCVSELGLSFIAYIFGGYCPFTTDRGVPTNFSSALCWEKVATTDKADVDLLFRTDYSISTAYIELVLSQELWNAISLAASLPGSTGMEFSAKARSALKARTEAGPGEAEIARACVPEWTVSRYDGEVIWRNVCSDRRLALRDHKLLKNVTEEDKKLEIHTLRMENPDSDEYSYNYGEAADVEESDPTAGAVPGVPRGPTDGDAPIKTPPNKAIPAYIQRAYDIAHKKELPTVGEVLNSITASAAEIVKTMRPGGGHDSLRPHLSSARTNSAVGMLDNLLDLEEVQRDRQREIDLLVDPDRVVEELRRERQVEAELAGYRFDEDGKVISRIGTALLAKPKRSPMQDLYLRVKANAKAEVQL